jgi:hypothetical protein
MAGSVVQVELPRLTSVSVTGTQINVTAGQVICSIAPTQSGYYMIQLKRAAGGSGTPALYNNGELDIQGDVRTLMNVPALDVIYDFTFYAVLKAGVDVALKAVTNGSANIGITGTIILTRIN